MSNFNARELATYFWIKDVGADENAIMNENVFDTYINLSKTMMGCYSQFNDVEYSEFISMTKDEKILSTKVYDIANNFAEKTNTDVKAFFRYIYLLLFENEKGPRLPSFIYLYGIENFNILWYNKMTNPFNISKD